MLQARLQDYGHIELQKSEIPWPESDQLLIRVRKTGICGSDVSTFNGQHPYKVAPTVLGHEFAGEVIQVGESVKGFVLGDRVCSAAYANCTRCEYCSANQHHLCEQKTAYSSGGWCGSFAEYVIAKPQKLYRLSSEISFLDGAMAEPLGIALHALKRTDLKDKTITVIGTGCIGLSLVLCAPAMGVRKTIAVDKQKGQSELAMNCGADEFLLPHQGRNQDSDVTFISASYDEAINDAVARTRSGGSVVTVAYFKDAVLCNVDALVRREIRLFGSALCEDEDMHDIIDWMAAGKIRPSKLLSHEYDLSQINRAMEVMLDDSIAKGKVVLTP